MSGLQRSAVSFRRQGSSGLVWDDRFLSGELNQEGKPQENQENIEHQQQQQQMDDINTDQHATTASNKHSSGRDIPPIKTIERNRSNGGGGRGYRTGRVSPAVDPPSPKVSACGFCSSFGKESKKARTKPPKRRSR